MQPLLAFKISLPGLSPAVYGWCGQVYQDNVVCGYNDNVAIMQGDCNAIGGNPSDCLTNQVRAWIICDQVPTGPHKYTLTDGQRRTVDIYQYGTGCE
ncbi:unnamed protein product [Cercospora beticola]|nr:unnamed protein product [Cercospora beticola]